ncbi:MAG TPA: hypothetical protein VGX70_16420 [Gemmataceae bacterium]|jgi:hypothetical protein|nr:hypothetical protein [Gemmataceae bacterium]
MIRLIYSLKLHRHQHILRARQRTRQIAGLLGYEPFHQSAVSAAVFAIAYKSVADRKTAKIQFLLGGDSLLIRCILCADGKVGRGIVPFRPVKRDASSSLRRSFAELRPTTFGDLSLEPGSITLTFPLPAQSPRLDAADLPWLIREIGRITPFDPLEEFYQLNRELLRLLRLAKIDDLAENPGEHAA